LTNRELLEDAEPQGADAARLRAADWFQVYPGEARGREAGAVAEQHRQDVHLNLVDQPPLQALAGDVGAEDLQVPAACGLQCGGDCFPDVTGEVRDIGVRGVPSEQLGMTRVLGRWVVCRVTL
jgi:hypothetical protein